MIVVEDARAKMEVNDDDKQQMTDDKRQTTNDKRQTTNDERRTTTMFITLA